MTVTVGIAETCTGCGMCIATCPERALRPGAKRPIADEAGCTACLACVEVCPVDAIDVTSPTPPTLVPSGWSGGLRR